MLSIILEKLLDYFVQGRRERTEKAKNLYNIIIKYRYYVDYEWKKIHLYYKENEKEIKKYYGSSLKMYKWLDSIKEPVPEMPNTTCFRRWHRAFEVDDRPEEKEELNEMKRKLKLL